MAQKDMEGGRSCNNCITESNTARGGMQTSCAGGEIGKWPTQAGSRSKKIGGAEHVCMGEVEHAILNLASKFRQNNWGWGWGWGCGGLQKR